MITSLAFRTPKPGKPGTKARVRRFTDQSLGPAVSKGLKAFEELTDKELAVALRSAVKRCTRLHSAPA